MKKRPLCTILLMFLVFQSVKYIMIDGQARIEVPVSSIFWEETRAEGAVLCGQVYKKQIEPEYQILYLKNNSITYQNQTYQESYIIVYEDTFQEVKIGQTVKLQGTLSRFESARNPGNFDAETYYAKQKLHGSFWCNNVVEVRGEENKLLEFLFQVRQQWKEIILDEMGEEQGGILCAMLLSEKGEMDEEIKELYQKNGYGHLLAISGLHISFVGLGIYSILRKLGVGYGVSSLLSLGLLTLYVLMLGFSVSVFRAYVMLALRIGADLSGRVYDMLTAVMLSAALIVCYEPLYLLDAGFQLSHGSILAIVFFVPALKAFTGTKGKLAEAIVSGTAINIALFPITLWYYYEIPTYAILWNLLVIPLMSGLLGLGMIGSIIPFANICLKLCKVILWIYEIIGELGNRFPWNRLVLGKPSAAAVIVFYLLIFIFVRWNKYLKAHAKIVCRCFLLSFLLFVKFPDGKLEITMLNVGQGDCIYVRAPNGQDYLIDGGSSDISQVGKYCMESFLKHEGVGSLEYVFVSHGDSDHCNGIEELLGRQEYSVKIKNLVLPANYKQDEALLTLARKAKEAGVKVVCMKKGMQITQGDFQVTCIQPGTEESALAGNAGSMVLDITFRDFSMLFTGDVEEKGEELLVQNLQGKSYQVLKVSHHGSKNSSSAEFLQTVKPRIALISAGKDNSYGHPHQETLDRLQSLSCKILQTETEGAIKLKTDGNALTIETHPFRLKKNKSQEKV